MPVKMHIWVFILETSPLLIYFFAMARRVAALALLAAVYWPGAKGDKGGGGGGGLRVRGCRVHKGLGCYLKTHGT